jgi:hypothetical protein
MNGDLWTYPESVGRLDVTGFDVEALDGDIGTVDETRLEADAAYLVVDTGRWIFGKKVFIPAGLVESVDRDDETVHLTRARDEIEAAPEYDAGRSGDPAYREQISAYYTAGSRTEEKDEEAQEDPADSEQASSG